MYCCLSCTPPSFIIFAHHYLIVHQFSRPILLVCHLSQVEVTCIISVWRGTANRLTVCAYSRTQQSFSGQCPDAGGLRPSIFKALIYPYIRFISCCYRVTVSTDISRLAANSASGTPFATVCVAAAEILSRYPSRESII